MAENEKKLSVVADKAAKKASEKAVKEAAKKKKEPLGKRIAKKFKDFKAEFKKIVWFSKKDTWNSTVLVIVVIIIVGVVIAALDYAFSTGLTFLGSLFH